MHHLAHNPRPSACAHTNAQTHTQESVSLSGGEPQVSSALTVTLSADHRVFDGELAARFLAAFSGYMAHPVTMIM